MKDKQFDCVLEAESTKTKHKCIDLIENEIGKFVLQNRTFDAQHLNALKIRLTKLIKEMK